MHVWMRTIYFSHVSPAQYLRRNAVGEAGMDMHSGATLIASFLASSVECVEAVTIVLAVGFVRGWQPALVGSAAALAVLGVLVAVVGPSLSLIPMACLQIAIGILLVLFGMRWLQKAVLRAAGVVPLRDEAAAFSHETRDLRSRDGAARWDMIGLVASFKAVMLEGVEVVFIVAALGAVGDALIPASLGAVAAAVLVGLIALMLHRPLARVPENHLKFAVGVMLSAFGTYWLGEGYGLSWPAGDFAILGLTAGFGVVALVGLQMIRQRRRGAATVVLN
jgi:Ca2+/H+ antiporter, TMEM165/GDT1 family